MPPPNAPDDALIARFRDDLTTLTGPLDETARIGVAVSGGPDSLALLLLAHGALPGRVAAATVDHGLRPEAVDEAAMVGRVCKVLGVPHVVLRASRMELESPYPSESWGPDEAVERDPSFRWGTAGGGNVQAKARMLRYRLLWDWARREALGFVATAHHRDDVAESFLMRALRGSGIGGLARMAAIRPIPYGRDDGPILVRPLLGWERAELAGIVRKAGLAAAEDPSNQDPRYDRARIRAWLKREPLLDAEQLARAAGNLADADAALEWIADQAWKSRAEYARDEIVLDPDDLPVEILRRLARRAIAALAPEWDGEGLDRMLIQLDARGTATLAGVKVSGGGAWRFRLAPARRGHR